MKNVMPDELAEKILSNKNNYSDEAVFLAEAYLCSIEVNIQDNEKENEPDEEHKHLFKFYQVDNYKALATIQSEHVSRLQKQAPKLRDR